MLKFIFRCSDSYLWSFVPASPPQGSCLPEEDYAHSTSGQSQLHLSRESTSSEKPLGVLEHIIPHPAGG